MSSQSKMTPQLKLTQSRQMRTPEPSPHISALKKTQPPKTKVLFKSSNQQYSDDQEDSFASSMLPVGPNVDQSYDDQTRQLIMPFAGTVSPSKREKELSENTHEVEVAVRSPVKSARFV